MGEDCVASILAIRDTFNTNALSRKPYQQFFAFFLYILEGLPPAQIMSLGPSSLTSSSGSKLGYGESAKRPVEAHVSASRIIWGSRGDAAESSPFAGIDELLCLFGLTLPS